MPCLITALKKSAITKTTGCKKNEQQNNKTIITKNQHLNLVTTSKYNQIKI